MLYLMVTIYFWPDKLVRRPTEKSWDELRYWLCKRLAYITRRLCGPNVGQGGLTRGLCEENKKLALMYVGYSLVRLCIDVSNSCISEKDKW